MGHNKVLYDLAGAPIALPDYGDKSITSIPKNILNELKKNYRFAPPTNKDNYASKKVLLVLVDGFGYAQAKSQIDSSLFIRLLFENNMLKELDTVFPSSTPVALNSIYSGGKMPFEHGLIDWWLYEPYLDDIFATLPFRRMKDDSMDALTREGMKGNILMDGMTFFEQLQTYSFSSALFIPTQYKDSTYTKTISKGSQIVTYDNIDDLFEKVQNSNNDLMMLYWADIDSVGHAFGPESNEYAYAVNEFFKAFEEFVILMDDDKAKHIQCILTSDHGQMTVDPAKTFFLDDIDGFEDLLAVSENGNKILPWGGVREVFIKVAQGKIKDMSDLLLTSIGGVANVINSDDAWNCGLFGQHYSPSAVSTTYKERIGDLLVIPKDKNSIWYRHPLGKIPANIGQHGGLSTDEIVVPYVNESIEVMKRCIKKNEQSTSSKV